MPDTMSINQSRLARESYCAFGPLAPLLCAGGITALLLPPLYKALIGSHKQQQRVIN